MNNLKFSNTIVIIEPSSSGFLLIEEATKLELNAIIISRDPKDNLLIENGNEKSILIIKTETHDEKLMKDTIKSLSEKYKIVGILPGFEYFVPIASRLSAYMCLPGLQPNTVSCLRLKNIMRNQLRKARVKIPKYKLIKTFNDLKMVEKEVGYPCV